MRAAGATYRPILQGIRPDLPGSRPNSPGITPDGVTSRRLGSATALLVAVLLAPVACTGSYTRSDWRPEASGQADRIEAGLDLYQVGEFVMAARRFGEVATAAGRDGDFATLKRARAAQCAAWLRARRLEDFDHCTARLETLQRRERRSDPGLNVLLAMGAIAGNRPPPPFKIPNAVGGVLSHAREASP